MPRHPNLTLAVADIAPGLVNLRWGGGRPVSMFTLWRRVGRGWDVVRRFRSTEHEVSLAVSGAETYCVTGGSHRQNFVGPKSPKSERTQPLSVVVPPEDHVAAANGPVIRSGDSIRSLTVREVRTAITQSPLRNMSVLALDRDVFVAPQDVWDRLIAECDLDRQKYVGERSDCDNFAFAFAALAGLRHGVNSAAVVIDYSSRHAYNAVLVDGPDGIEVRAYEPQSDRWVNFGESMYRAEQGFVVMI